MGEVAMYNRALLEEAIYCFTAVRNEPYKSEHIERLEKLSSECIACDKSDTPFPDTDGIAAEMHRTAFDYLIETLKIKQYDKASMFADVYHVFPEIFLYGRIAPIEHWNVFYARFKNEFGESPHEEYAEWFLERKLPLCGIHQSKIQGVAAQFDSVGGSDDLNGVIVRGGTKIMKHEISPTHLEIIRNLELHNWRFQALGFFMCTQYPIAKLIFH